MPLEALKRSPHASRKHPQKQLKQVAASISTYGFNAPVAIDSTNTIIAGHAGVAAAKLAGLTEIPTVRLSHLSPPRIRAYALGANKLADGATWDDDMIKVLSTDLCASNVDFDFEAIDFDPVEVDFIIHGTDDTPPDEKSEELLPQIRIAGGSATESAPRSVQVGWRGEAADTRASR